MTKNWDFLANTVQPCFYVSSEVDGLLGPWRADYDFPEWFLKLNWSVPKPPTWLLTHQTFHTQVTTDNVEKLMFSLPPERSFIQMGALRDQYTRKVFQRRPRSYLYRQVVCHQVSLVVCLGKEKDQKLLTIHALVHGDDSEPMHTLVNHKLSHLEVNHAEGTKCKLTQCLNSCREKDLKAMVMQGHTTMRKSVRMTAPMIAILLATL